MEGEQGRNDDSSRERHRQELAAISGGVDSLVGGMGVLAQYMKDAPSSAQPWEWAADDHDVLSGVLLVEKQYQPLLIPRFRPFFGPEEAVPPSRQRDTGREVARHMARYHAALPFDVAEREVLLEVCKYDVPLDGVERQIQQIETAVISGGVRCVIQGRDLMRRWWSWRRQADEFAGQGCHEVAQQALSDAAHLLGLLANGQDLPVDGRRAGSDK